MRVAVAALAVTVVAMVAWVALLAGQIRSESASIHKLEQKLQQLESKTAEKAKTASLENQAKCAEQARKVFADRSLADPSDWYQDHYNSDMTKCFVQIQSFYKSMMGRSIYDAFELKEYGSHIRTITKKVNRDMECWVILPSGEKKYCSSDREFDYLVKVYMEDGR